MQTSAFYLPSKFNSNIYTHREIISDKLSELVMFRINSETILCTSDDVKQTDYLLQSEHYKFVKVKTMIEISENDNYCYGSPAINSDLPPII